MKLVFLDIETSGLDPQTHNLLEYGLVTEDGKSQSAFNALWEMRLSKADSNALRINKLYDRINQKGVKELHPAEIAKNIVFATSGAVIAGANPHFDQHFLDVWVRRHGYAPAWDYHVFDVPTYVGALINRSRILLQDKKLLEPPFRMNNELLDAAGITRDESLKHTALGDASLARDLWLLCHAL